MGALTVIKPGMLTLVQDLGRRGQARQGVPASGAADSIACRVGNRLVGNAESAPVLEMTLIGGAFRFEGAGAFVLAGFCAARLEAAHAPSRRVEPFEVVAFESECELVVERIDLARVYLCIAGGLAVRPALGSASTLLGASLGGFEGRALRRGDKLAVGPAGAIPALGRRAARDLCEEVARRRTLRIVEGPHAPRFLPEARDLLVSSRYTVADRSDRTGVRLAGASISSPAAGRLQSEGMFHGALQIPADGEPIILGPDHPTTGGYPVIAGVIGADLPAVGQLRPREAVRFAGVQREEALAFFREQEARLRRITQP